MNRRSLFATLLAPLVALALPKKTVHHIIMWCDDTQAYKHYIGDWDDVRRQYRADPPTCTILQDSQMWKDIKEEGKRDMQLLQGDQWA